MELDIIYQRVGETRSGKMIPYTNRREETARIVEYFLKSFFTADDLLDVFAVFEYLALRAKLHRNFDDIFEAHAEDAFDLMSIDELESAKVRANINSAFHVRDLGKSLVNLEFVDL